MRGDVVACSTRPTCCRRRWYCPAREGSCYTCSPRQRRRMLCRASESQMRPWHSRSSRLADYGQLANCMCVWPWMCAQDTHTSHHITSFDAPVAWASLTCPSAPPPALAKLSRIADPYHTPTTASSPSIRCTDGRSTRLIATRQSTTRGHMIPGPSHFLRRRAQTLYSAS